MQKSIFPRVRISTLLFILMLTAGCVVSGIGYKLYRDALESAADKAVDRISHETSESLQRIISPSEMTLNLLDQSDLVKTHTLEERLDYLPFIKTILESSSVLSSVYVGYENGDFFLVRHLHNSPKNTRIQTPDGTHYMVQSIERNTSPPRGVYLYFDEDLNLLQTDEHTDYPGAYDPRQRVWFQDASQAEGQIKTAPYLFFSTQTLGMTLAMRSHHGGGVVGENILLETLNESLKAQKTTPGMQIALVNKAGEVFAHENIVDLVKAKEGAQGPYPEITLPHLDQLGIPILTEIAKSTFYKQAIAIENLHLNDGEQAWYVSITPLSEEGANPSFIVTAIPNSELFFSELQVRNSTIIVTGMAILALMFFTWWIARTISTSLHSLAGEAESIRHFEFSDSPSLTPIVLEIDELAQTMAWMKSTIRRFMEINTLVSTEENFDALLPKLLREVLSITQAESGILYLNGQNGLVPTCALSAHGRTPFPESLTDSLHTLDATVPGAEVIEKLGPLMGHMLQSNLIHEDVLTAEDVKRIGLESFIPAEQAIAHSEHAISVPLLNRRQQLVGAMLLMIGKNACDPARISFVTALSGFAASTLETRELIKTQKELFEAFVQLLAGAVDAKSPYTAAHCSRIPEITKMLAQAACDEKDGPFKDFSLTADEWEALDLAAWLHDCGKVTTPEYVVDKATKLETIYNRIHEIRMRFEVMKREAEIKMLRDIIAGTDTAEAQTALTQTLEELDDDFSFVASCNQGEECLAPGKVERLNQIAARTWTRTLDDRLGLSYEERRQKMNLPAPSLPVIEKLLADKPEHCIKRRPQDIIEADNAWGFKMLTPKLLYNRGELYNLTIRCGTLSAEERYKINEHIIQTQIMLSKLPFPKHLRNVPEIAGGHHEKMDGTGYPKGLKKDEMSPAARMMAIADIFEALTAIDRPYKEGKMLSESLEIMASMRDEHHIDPELFDLFLRAKIYQHYAEQFMRPEQIDEVDISRLMYQPLKEPRNIEVTHTGCV